MSRHVLVPVDGSEMAWHALEHAREQSRAATVTVLYVLDPQRGDYYHDDEEQQPVKRSEAIAAEARERFDVGTTAAETTLEFRQVTGQPSHAIVRFTEENDVDAIIMGSRGRSGVSRVLLGSVAEDVLRRAPVPVTVVR